MSAKTLERTIGTSYEVAWLMLHRFRVAMVNTECSQLSGEVEIDETFVGGTETGGKRGRGADKSIVAIAMEIKQPKYGYKWGKPASLAPSANSLNKTRLDNYSDGISDMRDPAHLYESG